MEEQQRAELFVEAGFRQSRAEGLWRVKLIQHLSFVAGRSMAILEYCVEDGDAYGGEKFYTSWYDENSEQLEVMTSDWGVTVERKKLWHPALPFAHHCLDELGLKPIEVPLHLLCETDLKNGVYNFAPRKSEILD